jgi:signal transduction histidine kinase
MLHVLVFAFFILLSRLSSVFQLTELRSNPWNPETGLAVVAGLLLRSPAIVTIAISIFVSTRLWGWALPGAWEYVSAITRSLIFAGSAAVVAPFLLRDRIPTLQTVLAFLGFSTLVTVAYAVARLLLLWASVGIEPSYLVAYTVTLSIGNLVAIVTLVPLFMLTDKSERLTAYLSRWSVFQWAMLAILVGISIVVFGVSEIDKFKFFYLIFLPVIAFSVRDGFAAAAFSVFVSDVLMIGILYWRDFESSTATELQFLMLSLSVTGLLLGTAISDRSRAVQELEDSHLRLQESQSALLQASRLSLASEMAAALAHELNQPLSSVRNYVRAIRRKLDAKRFDRSSLQTDIDAAVIQVDAAASMLRATRNFLERGSVQKSFRNIEQIIEHSADLVQPELQRARIALKHHRLSDLPPVVCNEIQIQQVLLNVIKNAREAMISDNRASGEIIIATSASNRPGFVEVSIADNGPGVSQELRAQLFKPLQSSKPEGLGLGLSLCSTIIRSHGGEFWLDENTVGGARFVFTLPCVTLGGRA